MEELRTLSRNVSCFLLNLWQGLCWISQDFRKNKTITSYPDKTNLTGATSTHHTCNSPFSQGYCCLLAWANLHTQLYALHRDAGGGEEEEEEEREFGGRSVHRYLSQINGLHSQSQSSDRESPRSWKVGRGGGNK